MFSIGSDSSNYLLNVAGYSGIAGNLLANIIVFFIVMVLSKNLMKEASCLEKPSFFGASLPDSCHHIGDLSSKCLWAKTTDGRCCVYVNNLIARKGFSNSDTELYHPTYY